MIPCCAEGFGHLTRLLDTKLDDPLLCRGAQAAHQAARHEVRISQSVGGVQAAHQAARHKVRPLSSEVEAKVFTQLIFQALPIFD